jgi:hypothetical protein
LRACSCISTTSAWRGLPNRVDGDTTLTVLGSHAVEAGTHTVRVSYLSFDAPLNVFEFHGAALFVPGKMASGVTVQLPR